jgi:hypothetical protein
MTDRQEPSTGRHPFNPKTPKSQLGNHNNKINDTIRHENHNSHILARYNSSTINKNKLRNTSKWRIENQSIQSNLLKKPKQLFRKHHEKSRKPWNRHEFDPKLEAIEWILAENGERVRRGAERGCARVWVRRRGKKEWGRKKRSVPVLKKRHRSSTGRHIVVDRSTLD